MKLVLREYLASLNERDELDAVLPDLLSELGFHVFSRPGRGTSQHGVDVAAVGDDEDGERKVFLLSVKKGDLTRQDWDGNPQSLRPSLNEIRDVYIGTRIPKRYQHLKIVICICLGGDIKEQVRASVTGYIEENTNNKVSFDEWNGDKIAGLMLNGILREAVLPKHLRSSFQKSVALADEPDVSYLHFHDLIKALCKAGDASQRAAITSSRQIYVCLWVLYIWGRDADNLEAPYRVSELAILHVWYLLRPFIGKKTKNAKAMTLVLNQLIKLHLTIAGGFLETKVLPHVGVRHGLSVAIETRNSVDVNLRMFELLGRIAMTSLWIYWMDNQLDNQVISEEAKSGLEKVVGNCFKMVNNNPILFSPFRDEQAIDIALVMLMASATASHDRDLQTWLVEMTRRVTFSIRTHGSYPCTMDDYRELIAHPRERSAEYRDEAMAGSTLIPMMACWLSVFGEAEQLEALEKTCREKISNCTMQLWLPDSHTEDEFYVGGRNHGNALCDLSISCPGDELLNVIAEACRNQKAFRELSAIKTGFWPVILLACRHYRMPVPPHFWIWLLVPEDESELKETENQSK